MLVESNPLPHGERRAVCATPISAFASIDVETGLLQASALHRRAAQHRT